MRNIISTVCLTFAVILGSMGVGYAHDGTYKITLDNWIKETPNIKDIGENTVTVKCNKRNNYNEIILLDSGLYPLIEFNQHIKNKTNSDSYLAPYSITVWRWLNSFGIKTLNLWGGAPWKLDFML